MFKKLSLLTVAVLFLVPGLAQAQSCYPDFNYNITCNPASPGYYVLLGDSTMEIAWSWQSVNVSNSPVKVVNAVAGSGIYHSSQYWAPRIAELGADFPAPLEVWVSLGTNDSGVLPNGQLRYPGLSIADVTARVGAIMTAINAKWPGVTVRWLMPSQTLPDAQYPPLAVYVVAMGIANAKASYPNLKVVDPTNAFQSCGAQCFIGDWVHFSSPVGVSVATQQLMLAQ